MKKWTFVLLAALVLPATTAKEEAVHYLCNLQVITDPDGIIKTFHSKGNEGCQRFVTALNM